MRATDQPAAGDGRWPSHLRPGAVRFARSSSRYEETVAFYRDLVGLPVVGTFTASYGEDGTLFGLPDTAVQLEIVRAHRLDVASETDQLVLYLDGHAAVNRATARLRAAGHAADPDLPAYWAANHAVLHRDPDGRAVLFAPWIFGREPEPAEQPHHGEAGVEREPAVTIDWFLGDRRTLRHLFEEAEDSTDALDAYIDAGRVLVARVGTTVVGHLQLVEPPEVEHAEIKNMAVVSSERSRGVGAALVEAAVAAVRAEGGSRLDVATAAADVGNLRFYQRSGFRFSSVERDAFDQGHGYAAGTVIDGIPLRDRVWLTRTI